MKRKFTLLGFLVFLFFGLNTNTFAQGDNCATAVVVTPGTYVADGPSAGAGAANICFTGATNADWYSYTPAADGTMTISSCGGGADTRLSVYTGTCGALVCYVSNDDFCDLGSGSAWASEVSGVAVTGGTTYYIEWDDRWSTAGFTWTLTYTPPPTCPAPTAQIETNITTTSADLGWTENGSATTWQIEWGTTGFVQGAGTLVVTASNPYLLSGLSAATTYDWYVRAICGVGDTSAWTGPSTFSTACTIVNTYPYLETFDGMAASSPGFVCTPDGSVPLTCWSNFVGEDIDWDLISGATGSSNTGPSDDVTGGGKYLYTETSSCYSSTGTVLSPEFDLSSLALPQLLFYYHMYGATMGTMSVDYTTDGGATWTQIWTLSGDQGNAWIQKGIVLSSLIGETSVQFRWVGLTGTSFTSDMAFDQVEVKEGPTNPIFGITPGSPYNFGECPLNNYSAAYYTQTFTVENVGGGTLTVSSTALSGGDAAEFSLADTNTYPKNLGPGETLAFDVSFGPTSMGAKTTTLVVNDNSKAVNNIILNGNAYVAPPRQLAGTPTATPSVDLTWEIPLPEGEIRYDDGTVESWMWVADPSSTLEYFYTRFNAPVAGNLNYVAVFNSNSAAGTNWESIIVCPDDGFGNPDLANPHETFATPAVNSTTGEWNLLQLTTPVGLAFDEVFYVLTQWPAASSTGPFVGVDTDNSSGRCAWSNDGGATWNAWGNNFIMRGYMSSPKAPFVEITAGPPVAGTENLPVVAINREEIKGEADQSAKTGLTFPVPGINSPAGASRSFSSYKVFRGTATGVYDTFFSGIATNSYSDGTIAPTTTYFYAVTGVYTGGDTSAFSNEVQVTTFASCPAPTAQVETNVTATSADLGWTENGSATTWNIEWGPTGFTQGSGTMITGTTTNPHSLTGLTAATTYDWYVQADCGGGSLSPWTGPSTFTTACPASTAIPYFENFDAVTAPAFPPCMTVEDVNADTYTWETSTTSLSAPNAAKVGYNLDGTTPMDDWFFTEGLQLTGGVTYEVSFAYAGQSSTYPEKLAVDWGTAANAASMSGTPIFDNNNILGGWYAGSGSFTPATTGTYFVGFHGYSDANMWNLYVDDVKVLEQVAATTWAGTVDNDWDTPGNWSAGLPSTTTDVTIPTGLTNYPTLASATTIGSLLVASDATGDASILNDGLLVVSGNATVQRYVTGGVWHNISASAQGQTLNSVYFGGTPEVWLTHYNEPTNTRTYLTALTDPMDPGAGFEIW
ncbi:MAG: choice-of-anchor D domain-containing protein, partial [Bacteroidales bacterium]|nr:choice-of-anchor D domain-containing protein [Bacteroidales bacterium]